MFSSDPTPDLLLRILILGPVGLFWVIILTRVIGLRTFSKMTAFDFIATVSTGSLLASAALSTNWGSFFQATGSMVAILGLQWLLARCRKHLPWLETTLANEPKILFRNGEFQRDCMLAERITEDDLYSKMREANALEIAKVKAIVLETTGDISVLHGDTLDSKILP